MAEQEFLRLMADVRDFDWDAHKREQTFNERGIDFDDARIAFQSPVMVRRTGRARRATWCSVSWLT
jgi:uncharacterized DUF497 family protein